MRRLSVLLGSAVIALTLIALTVATGAYAQPPDPIESYAAVYQGKNMHYFGDGTSKESAIRVSRVKCEEGDTNCKGQLWVHNGYLVVLQGKTQQGGVGFVYTAGHTEQEAVDSGMKACQQPPSLTDCKVIGSHRTGAYDPTKPTQAGEI
jgi:hypothetical protein